MRGFPTRRTFVAGAAMLAGAGCTHARPANLLRVSFDSAAFVKMYEAVAAAFTRENPDLRVELMPASKGKGAMHRDFRLALVEDEPDISHVSLNAVRAYVDRGLAMPLKGRIAASRTPLTRHPTIGRFGGETYALPFAISVPVLYTNADLIRRAGHDPTRFAAGGWPTILAATAAVPALGGRAVGIYADSDSINDLTWQCLVLGYGGRMMTPDERRIAFGDEAGLRAARLVRTIGGSGYFDMSRENARMAFAAGLLGIYQNTSSNMARFSSEAMGFEVQMQPMPVDPGTGRLPAAGNTVVVTTRKPERQDAAWRYAAFAAGPVGQTIMARMSGYLTLNSAALSDAGLLKPVLEGNAQYRALYAKLGILDAWFAFPGSRGPQVSSVIAEGTRSLLLGTAGPEEALAHMVARAQQLVDWR